MTGFLRGHRITGSRWRAALPALVIVLLGAGPLAAQINNDQAAAMVLNSARKAYNEKNYPFAITRFREFLSRYGNNKDAPSAHYGLALALLENQPKDYNAAIQELQGLAGNKNLPEYPFVLYYLGLAQRGMGTQELAVAIAKPQEAPQHRNTANQRFEEAAKQFAAALAAFGEVKDTAPDAKELPEKLEWPARARCDLAEMQLRTLKIKEAQATAVTFVKDPVLTRSRYRALGLYYHGFAGFLLQDYLAAGKSLSMLAPFNDLVFGTHARYLLARVHHLTGERPEATVHYEGVLADYDKHKKDAAELLQHPERFKNDADERAKLEALVREQTPPDHVARAEFFLGVLLYEAGKFGDALTHFTTFAQHHPGSPLLAEAQLRQAFCLVQLKQFADAVKALQPLEAKEPRLADQVIFWLGKTEVGAADPSNPQAYDQALRKAIDTFRRAADRAQQLSGADPEAKTRRAEMLLEMADTQQLAKQYREAATTYAGVLNDKLLPRREEELLQRQATALHLAGDYKASDDLCDRFQKAFPQSSLLPAILFRSAENAYFTYLAAVKNPNLPNRNPELTRLSDEVMKRYRVIVDKYPDFAHANLARFGLAMSLYRKGEIDKAREMLETIPPTDRTGDLAVVSYMLADCLLRLAPLKADDALAAGRIQEQVQAAAELLDGFIAGQPAAPETPDALIKLGFCHQRLATLLAQPAEKQRVLASARAAYEKLMQQFPNHPLRPQAVFERAKCQAQTGDMGGAINELRRFSNELKTAQVAPLAVLELATLLRGQNQAAQAADVLGQCRQQEATLLQNPVQAAWVPLLQYHHGVALKEAGKFTDARNLFLQTVRQFPNTVQAAEAALRYGQAAKEEGMLKITAARKVLDTANVKPPEAAPANTALAEGLKLLRDGAEYVEGQVVQLKDLHQEVRSRMLYEAAWAYRTIAEEEIKAARVKIAQELLKKQQDEIAKKTPQGQAPADTPLPDVPLAVVPLQPAEKKAQTVYQDLIDHYADLPLATDARFELSELLADRGQFEPAQKLLTDALDKEPPADLADKIHLRLGACLAAKGDHKAALAEFESVAQNPKSKLVAQGHYRAGETLMQTEEWIKAAAHFAVFRDQQPFQNLPGLSDRALLRLGHALGHAGQWDQSRQAQEALVGRFGNSPWADEARYGIGWAWQNQKQYDNAVNAYNQVTAHTATEIGAKAQLQIGLCRLEQKRYPEAATSLLIVPFTYDYPELSAVALSEAARAFVEMKQPEQAEKLLHRVIKDHPKSKWAEAARERLVALNRTDGGSK